MKLDEYMAGRKTWGIGILMLSLLIAGCGQTLEEEPSAPSQTAAAQEAEEERDDSDIYWEWAEDWISDMLLENESIEMCFINEGHELFSDEWYDSSSLGDRLTEPWLYVFSCQWTDKTEASSANFPEQDLTFLGVEYPRRAGDYKGWFIFSVWVKKTDQGVELGTDFQQKLFQYVLYECSREHYEEGAYLIGLSPSEQWMMWYPLYDILGEPVVMVSAAEEEKLEPVFRDACERMHERQEQVSGDLGQTVRFGYVFDDHSLAWWDEEPLEYEDFEDKERWQHYFTYMNEQREISGYRRWLRRYDRYYPEFQLDFHTGYDEEKQDIFQEMCAYRELYLEEQREREEAQPEEQPKEETQQGETQSDGREFWTVEKGDSLWRIAWQQYGDGSLWRQIYEKNREVIGEDGNVIFPGQVLELPLPVLK